MKKLKVTYMPPLAAVIAVILWICTGYIGAQFFGVAGFCVGVLVGLGIYNVVRSIGTTVQFGKGNVIDCKYFFYKWKIDLEKIDTFSYSIESHLTRGGHYSFDVKFSYSENGIEDCYKLNTSIGREDIRRCMDGESHKLEILQVYRYAERLYPEKAKGYVESDSIF
ncbi:hypothetical protein [Ruminococcus flavefaciens]|jgi:hypothetical protein|uniref:hypothetical protein n=1 Tax=Ruminococcus flavefaciens TaxID=1265 RepID=UPI000463ACF1|nr:hypothetical protein [Ruminococcus flavefaciens]